jgi:hypothetical protein
LANALALRERRRERRYARETNRLRHLLDRDASSGKQLHRPHDPNFANERAQAKAHFPMAPPEQRPRRLAGDRTGARHRGVLEIVPDIGDHSLELRRSRRRVLRSLKANGVSMIYVSHRLDEILAISDCLVVLRDGRAVDARRTADAMPESLDRRDHWPAA